MTDSTRPTSEERQSPQTGVERQRRHRTKMRLRSIDITHDTLLLLESARLKTGLSNDQIIAEALKASMASLSSEGAANDRTRSPKSKPNSGRKASQSREHPTPAKASGARTNKPSTGLESVRLGRPDSGVSRPKSSPGDGAVHSPTRKSKKQSNSEKIFKTINMIEGQIDLFRG